uniref:Uncharacterized protein n=1 Tax=Anguilla anguilla TaxID=7936 RepID=A0A0E9R528_ANGAN
MSNAREMGLFFYPIRGKRLNSRHVYCVVWIGIFCGFNCHFRMYF